VIFTETEPSGAYPTDLHAIEDEHGFFARCFCREEFAPYGLPGRGPRSNGSYPLRGAAAPP
jgi:dTDP-4-dehydrorhamnose 3,5-epimerase-like enzyme